MKNVLLEVEAILSNATAELSMPTPNCKKAGKGIDVARNMLLDLAEKESKGVRLIEAKRKLLHIYLGMRENEFSDGDVEIFSILSKENALQHEVEKARKNN
jgi:hypothetical protein